MLVTNASNALVVESINGQSFPSGTNRFELLPGEHTLVLRPEARQLPGLWNTGSFSLTFVAEAGHTYRVRGAGDIPRRRWTARIEDVGPGEAGSRTDSPADLQATCGSGVAASCLHLGALYERGDSTLGWDEGRAAQMYNQACAGGQPLGCTSLGKLYEAGHGLDKDEGRAAGLFEQACSAGEVRGCDNLGSCYQEGRGVRRDERRAADLYEKACGAGEPTACFNLGGLYRDGLGVDPDEGRAATLYEKACAGGEPKGCTGLGLLYEDGVGVEHDEGRAAALYEKACAGGSAVGCANLGVLYQLGLGTGRNDGRAIAMFKKACTGGVDSACASLATLEPRGRWGKGGEGSAARSSSSAPAAGPSVLTATSTGGEAALVTLQLSLRGEADVLHPALVGAVAAELAEGPFSGVVTLIVGAPPAGRLEARFYPLQWVALRPYVGLGASVFLPAAAGRVVAGVDLQFVRFHLFVDVAYERFFNTAPPYAAQSLLLAMGAGWHF